MAESDNLIRWACFEERGVSGRSSRDRGGHHATGPLRSHPAPQFTFQHSTDVQDGHRAAGEVGDRLGCWPRLGRGGLHNVLWYDTELLTDELVTRDMPYDSRTAKYGIINPP